MDVDAHPRDDASPRVDQGTRPQVDASTHATPGSSLQEPGFAQIWLDCRGNVLGHIKKEIRIEVKTLGRVRLNYLKLGLSMNFQFVRYLSVLPGVANAIVEG
ncbi:hypothetical protein KSP40_PGU020400 [Platanthera guangdongensis]|uniref:Uncharacterized protein n=1 Tax=Platanthera guangdongensis TaxID=2320717 RepID=A0ABR2LSU6_9ASPA